MFPRGSGSQESFSPRRNQSNIPNLDSSSNTGSPSSLIDSVETRGFSQDVLPGSGSEWPVQSVPSAAQDPSQSATVYAHPVPIHQSATGVLNASQPQSLLSPDYPVGEPIGQPSTEYTNSIKQKATSEDPRGLGVSVYPMSVASEVYFAGPMQHNPHNYAWANRPYQPLQPPSGHMSPPFVPSHQPYSSPGYSMGYPGQTSESLSVYQQQEPQIPSSYLTESGNLARHSQPRSPSFTRPFQPPNIQIPTPLPVQPLMTSFVASSRISVPGRPNDPKADQLHSPPPYMMNHSGYQFPDSPAIQSHPTPNSSQPPSMIAPEPIYSSPETSATTDTEHPVRVLNSRPRPQCWEHGCNGREFSTFSNLLRHQREKSGVVAKAECPVCGAVFTRTTARNIHVAQGKCKGAGRESSVE